MKKEIAYGQTEIHCNSCDKDYLMRTKDIQKVARQNGGYVPCYFCGSQATIWQLADSLVEENSK